MNVNREGKFKISVVKSNNTTLKIVKERTLEETMQYNRRQRVLNPLTMSEFYHDSNMHDPHTSIWSHDYSNSNPFNRNYQFNNNFESSEFAASLINTRDWPSHTHYDYDYYNGLYYYEYDSNHSNFSPPVDSHSLQYNQNKTYRNDYSQYQNSKEHNCQNNYYAQSLISSEYEYHWKSRTLVTISSNVQQQNNKKLKFMDKKQIGFSRPNYQKKSSSVKRRQERKKVDRYPRTKPICDISPTTKCEPIKCEIIDLCENYPTTIKITSHSEIVSEEVKRNSKTEIKDVSIETNEKCATNTIKIKNGTETVSEKVKRNENSETYAPNNQDLCEIKDVSIETKEKCATNTIKIKNSTETVSKRLKRIENPETNSLNNQDICKIKDVSYEAKENCKKNTIKIINGTESVLEDVKRKKNPETKSNNQNLSKIKGVSIETQDICNTQQVCSDCKEVFPCNTQQNYEKKIDVTKKNQNTKILEIGNGYATKNKSYSSATNSIGNHKKTIKSSLSRNKKSLDQSMLTRKEKVDNSKFLKASKNNKSDNGSNIFNKDINNSIKKKSYIDTFYKQKVNTSYKIPKLSKYKIEDNSESNVNESNTNVNKISEGKKGVKVIGDVKSTKNILESRGNSTYIKVKKSENNINKKISIDNLSRDEKTVNKSNQLKCNNKANRISLEKLGVNVNRAVTSIKNSSVSPKIPTHLKSTDPKETSIDIMSRSDKVSKRIETKHYDSAKSIHSKLQQAYYDKNVNTIDGERDVSCNKDTNKINIVTNKTKSGDKAISKINSSFSETTKKRKLTVDENIKDKKKHKVETGKLTSKTKPEIVKTCNEQFNTSKSLVHVSNDLVVEKPNKQNSRHKSSSRSEKLTKTLKEDREGLLITVDKDKKINMKSNVKDEKHKIKKHTKQNTNLNIIINITYPEKTSKQKCTKETYSVEDLSFLDDFNVDEIVKSLDNC